MKTRTLDNPVHTLIRLALASALLTAMPTPSLAQVPVDDQGRLIGDYESSHETAGQTGEEGIPLLSAAELETLVGPVALYPDDLLAIVLPAATYPLQLVEAQRFLDALADDPTLKPDEDWDDSVVALTNYPEIVALLNEDLDWTWQLGEAVVAQQADVVAAVAGFRERAYAAGNLRSDGNQIVARNDNVIEITPVTEDVIYVPYYEPKQVVVYQPRTVYHYYPRPYPVYYYPYPSWHSFHSGFFWGVTTAYTIGWRSDRVHVYHHSYLGHPYYGRSYWDRWWYRRPSIHVHNSIYINRYNYTRTHRYRHGDYWRPRYHRRYYTSNQRITRNRYYPDAGSRSTSRSVSRPVPRTTPRSTSRTVSRPTTVHRSGASRTISRPTTVHRNGASRTISRPTTVHRSGERRNTGSADTTRREVTSNRYRNEARSNTARRYSTQHNTAPVTRPRTASRESSRRNTAIRNDAARQARSIRVETPQRVAPRTINNNTQRRTERQSRPSQVRQTPSSRQRQQVTRTNTNRNTVTRTRTAEPRATQSRQSTRKNVRRNDSSRHRSNRNR